MGYAAGSIAFLAAFTVCAVHAAAPPPHDCGADADAQQLSGTARALFLQRCENGRTPPIMGTPNQPDPNDTRQVCRAKAIGDKMTGLSQKNYIRACMDKAGR